MVVIVLCVLEPTQSQCGNVLSRQKESLGLG